MEIALYIIEMVLLGVGVGLLSGALGLGGGILMVPAFMTFVHGMDTHTAKGTSLFIIIFVSFLNAIRLTHGWPSRPWRLSAVLSVGSVSGGYLGAYFTALMPDRVVVAIFMVLLGALSYRTFLLVPRIVAEDAVRERWPASVLIGFVAGLAGGATGTGGGAVLIPLALMAGIASNERVVGLSNMVMVVTSLAGSMAHLQADPVSSGPWVHGHVDFALVPLVFLGAQLGSPWGQRLDAHLTLHRRRVAMGILLAVISLRLLIRLVDSW